MTLTTAASEAVDDAVRRWLELKTRAAYATGCRCGCQCAARMQVERRNLHQFATSSL